MNVALVKLSNARPLGFWLALTALLLILPVVNLAAEEADTTAVEERPSAEERNDPDAASSPEPDSERPSSEVFIPTEEISEDFAVSFPVDI